jgi:predicted small lipoprotein YifL
MSRRYFLAATILGLAACGTNGPEVTELPDNIENSTVDGNMAAADGQLDFIEAPVVPALTARPAVEPQVICRKERRIGSNIAKRVCRTREEIEAERAEGQNTLEELSKRTYSGPNRGDASY